MGKRDQMKAKEKRISMQPNPIYNDKSKQQRPQLETVLLVHTSIGGLAGYEVRTKRK